MSQFHRREHSAAKRQGGMLVESTCAEGEMGNHFKQDVEPVPMAAKFDF